MPQRAGFGGRKSALIVRARIALFPTSVAGLLVDPPVNSRKSSDSHARHGYAPMGRQRRPWAAQKSLPPSRSQRLTGQAAVEENTAGWDDQDEDENEMKRLEDALAASDDEKAIETSLEEDATEETLEELPSELDGFSRHTMHGKTGISRQVRLSAWQKSVPPWAQPAFWHWLKAEEDAPALLLEDWELRLELPADDEGAEELKVDDAEEAEAQLAAETHSLAPGPFTTTQAFARHSVCEVTPHLKLVMHSFCAAPGTYTQSAPTQARCCPLDTAEVDDELEEVAD